MNECFDHVARCRYVILLQTRSVLKEQWPLLATYIAARSEVPIICVVIAGGGYDFATAEDHLAHLNERLDAAVLSSMSDVLSGFTPPKTVSSLQAKLCRIIPHVISVVYHQTGSRMELAATVSDIDDKQQLLQVRNRRRSSVSFQESLPEIQKEMSEPSLKDLPSSGGAQPNLPLPRPLSGAVGSGTAKVLFTDSSSPTRSSLVV
jgi:hypothetical protein